MFSHLDEAMPALEAAERSLQALNKNDITEVRSMKRPPTGVVYVIESICIVKGVKPKACARFFVLSKSHYVRACVWSLLFFCLNLQDSIQNGF